MSQKEKKRKIVFRLMLIMFEPIRRKLRPYVQPYLPLRVKARTFPQTFRELKKAILQRDKNAIAWSAAFLIVILPLQKIIWLVVCSILAVGIALLIFPFGYRFDIKGIRKIKIRRPALLIWNHVSILDTFIGLFFVLWWRILSNAQNYPVVLIKASYIENLIIGFLARLLGGVDTPALHDKNRVELEGENRAKAKEGRARAKRYFIGELKKGRIGVIYGQGTRVEGEIDAGQFRWRAVGPVAEVEDAHLYVFSITGTERLGGAETGLKLLRKGRTIKIDCRELDCTEFRKEYQKVNDEEIEGDTDGTIKDARLEIVQAKFVEEIGEQIADMAKAA